MFSNYELVEDEKTAEDGLFRIRAVKDLPGIHIRKGELGGRVEGLHNLAGGAWIYPEGSVRDSAVVHGNARVLGSVRDNAVVSENAKVHRNSMVCGKAIVQGGGVVGKNVTLAGNTVVAGNAILQGQGTYGLYVCGGTFNGFAYVNAEGAISGGLFTDNATIKGHFTYNGAGEGALHVVAAPEVTKEEHYLYLGKLGSEGVDVFLYRAGDGVPWISVGCWKGPLSSLMDEVRRRYDGDEWANLTQLKAEVLFDHYRGVKKICDAQIRLW